MDRIRGEKVRVLLGVTGSVAAIRTPRLVDQLANSGAEVKVLATERAAFFLEKEVTVLCDEEEWLKWEQLGDDIMHIELRRWADLFIIAPLSANTLAKLANGLCDNALTCTARAWDARQFPLLVAPAMNTNMWDHPLTRKHLDVLESLSIVVIPPISKKLACGDVGTGAMAAIEDIVEKVGRGELRRGPSGYLHVVLPAGRMEEAIASLFAVVLRCATGLFPHSGEGKPPMHGDFEAQRHWMELTRGKEVSEWYRYDLEYWGLDYPPLSAFHAYATSYALEAADPAAVVLDSSRGYEGAEARAAMRATVVLWDLLVLFPAAWMSAAAQFPVRADRIAWFWAVVCAPALLLVDHGHFQYNGVSLGLVVLAVDCVLRGYDALGAAFYAMSVNFKHLSLYYFPALAGYVLGRARSQGLPYLARVGATSVVVTAASWAPFDKAVVFERLFPVARGLFEDKVANFWCSVSPLVKFHVLLSKRSLFGLSAFMTCLAASPGVYRVWREPTPMQLMRSLALSSLSCFLFAYQVHEKQVLLPQLAVAMLSQFSPDLYLLFSTVAALSLFPLLRREGLTLAYIAHLGLLFGTQHLLPSQSARASMRAVAAALAVLLAVHAADLLAPEVPGLPDLHTLVFTAASFGCLALVWAALSAQALGLLQAGSANVQ